MIKIVEWFGGIGASTKAFKRMEIEHEIVDYVELDKHAVNSYNAINDTSFKPINIMDVDTSKYGEIDLLIAGWPCQDYSVAGKGMGTYKGNRSSLVLTTIDQISEMEIKPKRVLLENVKGLLSKKFSHELTDIKGWFEDMGYIWEQVVLNSKYFDIPQSRERVFIVLTRKDIPFISIKHLLEKNTVNKVLRDVLDFSVETKELNIEEALKNKNVVIKDGRYFWKLSDGSLRVLFEIKGDNKTINIPHSNNYTNNVLGTQKGQMPTIMAGSTRYVYFNEPTNMIKLTKDNHIKYTNFITIPRASDGKLINGYHNRLWSAEKYSGTISASATPKVYFTNEMKQYTGKTIQLDIEKLNNQDRNKINKVATLGTMEPDFKDHSFNQKKHFLGIDGIVKTLRAGDCDSENKIIFNDVKDVIFYRKLSTLECWRLMGFDDKDHDKVKAQTYLTKAGKEKRLISDSQLAKQAGNSIVVNVLEAIFNTLF